jgi:hypothetical protein
MSTDQDYSEDTYEDADRAHDEQQGDMSKGDRKALEVARHPGSTKAIMTCCNWEVTEKLQGWLSEDETRFVTNGSLGWSGYNVEPMRHHLLVMGLNEVIGYINRKEWTL